MILRSFLVVIAISIHAGITANVRRQELTITECAAKLGECDESKGRPVCGTDDHTYPTRCHLLRVQCSGHQVSVKYRGPCRACSEAREYALKHRANSFIPRCKSDGTYALIQCLADSGCWCSDITGTPIENTTVRTGKPKCREFSKGNMRRSPSRNASGNKKRPCLQSDRATFNNNLMKVFQSEYIRMGQYQRELSNRRVMEVLTPPSDTEVLDWKFSQLDVNTNQMLDKIEYRELKKLVRRAVKPRRCGRAFGKFCDVDSDERLSRSEWNSCLSKDGANQHLLNRGDKHNNNNNNNPKPRKNSNSNNVLHTNTAFHHHNHLSQPIAQAQTPPPPPPPSPLPSLSSAPVPLRPVAATGGHNQQTPPQNSNQSSSPHHSSSSVPLHVNNNNNIHNHNLNHQQPHHHPHQHHHRHNNNNHQNRLHPDSYEESESNAADDSDDSSQHADDDDDYDDADEEDHLRLISTFGSSTKLPSIYILNPKTDTSPKESDNESDCLADQAAALEEQKHGPLYVPDCTPDGRYQRVQCYNSTPYCWCVNEDTGKNIPGTSVKDRRPQCDSIYTVARTMKGCPDDRKVVFLKDLKEFLKNKIITGSYTEVNRTAWSSEDERIATLSFVLLDKNKNKAWERKEWKTFRELMANVKNLRKCGRKMPRYCDANSDKKITLTEWTSCLQAHRPSLAANTENDPQQSTVFSTSNTSSSKPPKLTGSNPLEQYLKD